MKTKTNRKIKYKNVNILSNIIGIIMCVIFSPVLIFNTVIIIKSISNPHEIPKIFNYTQIIENTDLMTSDNSPIKNGALLFFNSDISDLKFGKDDGSIVAITTGNNTVIIRRMISSYTDENGIINFFLEAENPRDTTLVEFASEQIVGVFAFRVPNLGKVILFSHRPIGTFVMFILPLFLLMITAYIYFSRNKDKVNIAENNNNKLENDEEIIVIYDTVSVPEKYIEYELYMDEDGNLIKKVINNL